MSNIPNHPPHHNAAPATREADNESPDSPFAPVIVDEGGKPYRKETDAKETKNTEQQILDRVKTGERWMIVLTGVVALTTVAQFALAYYNGGISANQINQIIVAANGVKDSAASFSKSADGINKGVSDATGKLNLQAGALKDSVQQASRLAGDTEIANANVIDSDRPWMGGNITVSNFEAGAKPILNYTFVNSGKRPGRIEALDAIGLARSSFPPDIEIRLAPPVRSSLHSKAVAVPGQSFGNPRGEQETISQADMSFINSGGLTYYAIAKVEYRDIRTNTLNWTHICVQYVPKKNGVGDWKNCNEYNDAQ